MKLPVFLELPASFNMSITTPEGKWTVQTTPQHSRIEGQILAILAHHDVGLLAVMKKSAMHGDYTSLAPGSPMDKIHQLTRRGERELKAIRNFLLHLPPGICPKDLQKEAARLAKLVTTGLPLETVAVELRPIMRCTSCGLFHEDLAYFAEELKRVSPRSPYFHFPDPCGRMRNSPFNTAISSLLRLYVHELVRQQVDAAAAVPRPT